MELLVDTHTHTTFSGHAYSTLMENLDWAAKRGLEGFVVSDHTDTIPGAQPNFTIKLQKVFPCEYEGVRIIRGCEANIINYKGHIDIHSPLLKIPQFVIASLHRDVAIRPGSKEENTNAMLGALDNPFVDIIGHPGNPAFEIDVETVVKHAKKQNKLLEINNHSFQFRAGSEPICKDIITLCKKYGVRLSVGTDAHLCLKIGDFQYAKAALEELNFPPELVVSRNMSVFDQYLQERQKRLSAANAL